MGEGIAAHEEAIMSTRDATSSIAAQGVKDVHRLAYQAAVIERDREAVGRYMDERLADQLWEACQAYFTAFPDLHVVVEEAVAEGERVAARLLWTGTHDGDLPGQSATGRQIALESVDFARVQDGRIVEFWNLVDRATMSAQLAGSSDVTS
jgi:steroid delta-isomerase-like uncharacterized protein